MPNLVEGFLWYFAFLFSLCFHEGAHALVGYRLGDDTAHDQGQVSMNPIPHIKQEPFGTVIAPILMFLSTGSMIGWASAPYNPSWALSFPKRSALVSLAGPVANLIIVLTCSVIFRIGLEAGLFQVAGWMSYADIVDPSSAGLSLGMARILGVLYSLNVLYCLLLIFCRFLRWMAAVLFRCFWRRMRPGDICILFQTRHFYLLVLWWPGICLIIFLTQSIQGLSILCIWGSLRISRNICGRLQP